jgi:regulator of ribonuclease activity A
VDAPVALSTTDLCDRHEDELRSGLLQVAPPPWITLGAVARFAGPCVTLRVPDDNSLVRRTLEQPGDGRVLVVDGGASLRCALLGGNLGKLAEHNRWSGVVVNGCVRDADELDACRVGIRALHLMPRRSEKRGLGELDVVLGFAGLTVHPGDWIYADRDGWLVARRAIHH